MGSNSKPTERYSARRAGSEEEEIQQEYYYENDSGGVFAVSTYELDDRKITYVGRTVAVINAIFFWFVPPNDEYRRPAMYPPTLICKTSVNLYHSRRDKKALQSKECPTDHHDGCAFTE